MSKVLELQDLIKRQMAERHPDLPYQLSASEEGWADVLAAIEPGISTAERRAGPMEFAGFTVVIDPGLPAGCFQLRFKSDLSR